MVTPIPMTDLSPAPWPPKEGELVVLLCEPRGYAGILTATQPEGTAEVILLDDADRTPLRCQLTDLIPTGKRLEVLCALYTPTADTLCIALQRERGVIEVKRKAAGGAKPKAKPTTLTGLITAMTPEDKASLRGLLQTLLKQKGDA